MTSTMNRRAALGALAGAGAILAHPHVSDAADFDAELVALSAQIIRRCAEAEQFQETRISVFEDRFQRLGLDRSKPQKVRWEEACAFSRDSGRDAAIEALYKFDEVTDRLFDRLMTIPATGRAGRAAKVRALIVHVMLNGWRGPADELDWEKEQARRLLGEFAGLSAEELEAI